MTSWLAQTSPTDPIGLFIQYGIAGLVIMALITGLLWARPSVENLIKRAERAEAQRDELMDLWNEKVFPALTEAASVNRDLIPVLSDVVAAARSLKEFDENQRKARRARPPAT